MRSNSGLKDLVLTFHFPYNRTCQFKLALKITKEVKQIQVIPGNKMNLICSLTSHLALMPSVLLAFFWKGWGWRWRQKRLWGCDALGRCLQCPLAEVSHAGGQPPHTQRCSRGTQSDGGLIRAAGPAPQRPTPVVEPIAGKHHFVKSTRDKQKLIYPGS